MVTEVVRQENQKLERKRIKDWVSKSTTAYKWLSVDLIGCSRMGQRQVKNPFEKVYAKKL